MGDLDAKQNRTNTLNSQPSWPSFPHRQCHPTTPIKTTNHNQPPIRLNDDKTRSTLNHTGSSVTPHDPRTLSTTSLDDTIRKQPYAVSLEIIPHPITVHSPLPTSRTNRPLTTPIIIRLLDLLGPALKPQPLMTHNQQHRPRQQITAISPTSTSTASTKTTPVGHQRPLTITLEGRRRGGING